MVKNATAEFSNAGVLYSDIKIGPETQLREFLASAAKAWSTTGASWTEPWIDQRLGLRHGTEAFSRPAPSWALNCPGSHAFRIPPPSSPSASIWA
jgi:hypothetical protein